MMDEEPLAQLMLILLGGTMGVIPLALLVSGITVSVHKRRALRTFVRVEAVVLSTRLIEVRTPENEVWYRPGIEYEYEARGVRHRSANIWSGTSSARSDYGFSMRKAQRFVDMYPPGIRVKAFHDPHDPTQAFLVRRHPFLHEHLLTFLGGFGVLFIFGAAWGFHVFWQLSGVMLLTILCIVTWVWWHARRVTRG